VRGGRDRRFEELERENRLLRQQLELALEENERLRQEQARLREEIERLRRQLEEGLRAAKRRRPRSPAGSPNPIRNRPGARRVRTMARTTVGRFPAGRTSGSRSPSRRAVPAVGARWHSSAPSPSIRKTSCAAPWCGALTWR
jgi:septal ring factor EnvC (AmiA/AmiB activator)